MNSRHRTKNQKKKCHHVRMECHPRQLETEVAKGASYRRETCPKDWINPYLRRASPNRWRMFAKDVHFCCGYLHLTRDGPNLDFSAVVPGISNSRHILSKRPK